MSEPIPEDFDFTDAPREEMAGDRWANLRKLIGEQARAKKNMDEAKANAEAAEAAHTEYRDKLVPTAAKGMGWTGGNVDGYTVKIKDDVVGSIPTDKVEQASAFAYLEELGEGPSIKRIVTIDLDRDAADLERRIVRRLTMHEVSYSMAEEMMARFDKYRTQPEGQGDIVQAMRMALHDVLGLDKGPLVQPESISSKVSVHANTLCKIARDRIKAGLTTDLPRLGLLAITRSEVKSK